MKTQIITSYTNGQLSKGLVVVIDVFRAFSTACYVINSGADKIFPVNTPEEAFNLKKQKIVDITIAEVNGIKADKADFSNSPTEIEHISFHHKNVAMATSAGTKGLIAAAQVSKDIITGSMVNLMAVAEYIKQVNPELLTLLCTDGRWLDNEDVVCAQMIIDYLENKKINFNQILHHLKKHPSSQRLVSLINRDHSNDFEKCMLFNRFNFILKTSQYNERLILSRENPPYKTTITKNE